MPARCVKVRRFARIDPASHCDISACRAAFSVALELVIPMHGPESFCADECGA